ncbi:DUF2254 domain-containing protein [Nereida sp. MMG025]|uniref:DUF2254 domain-containing protein n=1 Tax=Nereida sp. MMG025 TaxID=2909981 RepID=UPI001F4474F8|nr:DUF2254 domain-containing protein [Nereida sp. MMG025]MCF6445868.1 DUF2254 domain-containing protein [Nereida sp. MMG025]
MNFDLSHLSLMQSWQWFRRTSRILWVRVAMIAVLSILAALSANVLDPLIPEMSKNRFSAEATLPVLNVLASSMLAVATFSLGIMVSSHRTLAAQSTPRIHQLLVEDTSTQSVLATFIGAFVYALSAIILFRAGYYNDSAAVVVFGSTVLVVVTIVVSLVRWIGRLSHISSLDYALDRAEEAAREVLKPWRKHRRMGCRAREDHAGAGDKTTLVAPASGYVLRFLLSDLQDCAEARAAQVVLDVLPGQHVLAGDPLGYITGCDEVADFVDAIVLGPVRSYEQDPRYAVQALRESAQKALSPGINDPGTAVEVINRLERLLWGAFKQVEGADEVLFDRIWAGLVTHEALIETAFREIARDGRDSFEVITRTRDAALRVGGDSALMADIDAYARIGLDGTPDTARYGL